MSAVSKFKLLPEVDQFLGTSPIQGFAGGKHFPTTTGTLIASIDPGSGEKITDIPDMSAAEVSQAVDIANHAFPKWAALPQKERSALLLKLADAVESKKAVIGCFS